MALFKKQAAPDQAQVKVNPIDLETLARINQQSPPDTRREWAHSLYLPTEETARRAASEIEANDWLVTTVEEADDDSGDWLVVALRRDVVLSAEAVCRARQFFEGVAGSARGGQYDGWQASL